jgi:predicted CoA-binding protein
MKRDLSQEPVVRQVFSNYKRFALYGMSGNKIRPSYFVGSYLAFHHFNFVSIHPQYETLFGYPCYKKMKDISPTPEVVVVFRRAEETPQVALEAVEIGAKVLWLQYGIRWEETRKIAENAGLLYVEDRCIKVEHARYFGNLHDGGINTGLISSKKKKLLGSDPVSMAEVCEISRAST